MATRSSGAARWERGSTGPAQIGFRGSGTGRDLLIVGVSMPDGSMTYTGSTTMFSAGQGSCRCGKADTDEVLVWTPTTTGTATIEMQSPGGFDTLLHVRTDCADSMTELGCNDDAPGTDSRVAVDVVAGVPIHIIADACSGRGEYPLRLMPP
jgi:hypothetical protein